MSPRVRASTASRSFGSSSASRRWKRASSAWRTCSARSWRDPRIGATSRAEASSRYRSTSSATISRTLSASTARPCRPRSAQSRRSSRSRRVTPGSSAALPSTSLGTAMSRSSRGRAERRATTDDIRSWSMIGISAPVQVTTTSAEASSSPRVEVCTTRPPTRSARADPRSGVRLATTSSATPLEASATAVPSPTSPAPTTTTFEPASDPSRSSAISTAAWETEAVPRPIPVSDRARLPTSSARRKSRFSAARVVPSRWANIHASRTCPRISDSPSTAERRPPATSNRWVAASSSCWLTRWRASSSGGSPAREQKKSRMSP